MPYDKVGAVSTVPQDYTHLFDQDGYLSKMSNRQIEDIILEVCKKERDFETQYKFSCFHGRRVSQEHADRISSEKVSTYRQKGELHYNILGVVCSILQARAGQTALGGFLGAATNASDMGSKYRGRINQSELESLEHHSKHLDMLNRDHSQGLQGSDQRLEQYHNMLDRIVQMIQRTMELMVSSSS